MKKIIFIILLSLCLSGCNTAAPDVKDDKPIYIKPEITQKPIQENIPIVDDKKEIETIEEETQETEIPVEPSEPIINASEKEIEVFYLVNKLRASSGLNELIWDDNLYYYSSIRSEEASRKWSHIRPDGTSWKEMNPDVLQGENLAKGYYNADEVVNAWMASQGHKENILRANFTRTAVSFYEAENGWFWCQVFGY